MKKYLFMLSAAVVIGGLRVMITEGKEVYNTLYKHSIFVYSSHVKYVT